MIHVFSQETTHVSFLIILFYISMLAYRYGTLQWYVSSVQPLQHVSLRCKTVYVRVSEKAFTISIQVSSGFS